MNGIANFFADREYDLVIAGDLVSIPYVQAAGLQQFPVWIDRARVDLHFKSKRMRTVPVAWGAVCPTWCGATPRHAMNDASLAW